MNPLRAILVALLAGALAAACEGARWEHPGVPQDRWPADQAACHRQATEKVEKDLSRDQAYRGDPHIGRGPSAGAQAAGGRAFDAQMARFEAIKSRRAYFERCMQGRGYRKVKPAAAD